MFLERKWVGKTSRWKFRLRDWSILLGLTILLRFMSTFLLNPFGRTMPVWFIVCIGMVIWMTRDRNFWNYKPPYRFYTRVVNFVLCASAILLLLSALD